MLLRSITQHVKDQNRFARESRSVLSSFIATIEGESSSDTDLVNHTSKYLTSGVFFAKFRPSHATFDELKSTGNLGFDALRFDARTSALFSQRSTAEAAQQIRDNKDLLMRHAALHYWLKDRALEILEGASDRSDSVLRRIESAQQAPR